MSLEPLHATGRVCLLFLIGQRQSPIHIGELKCHLSKIPEIAPFMSIKHSYINIQIAFLKKHGYITSLAHGLYTLTQKGIDSISHFWKIIRFNDHPAQTEPIIPIIAAPTTDNSKTGSTTKPQYEPPSKPAFNSPESVKARVKDIIATLKKVNLKSPREKIEEGLASLIAYWDRLPSKADDEAPIGDEAAIDDDAPADSPRKFIAWIDLEYSLIGNTAISEIEAALDGIWSDYTADRAT